MGGKEVFGSTHGKDLGSEGKKCDLNENYNLLLFLSLGHSGYANFWFFWK